MADDNEHIDEIEPRHFFYEMVRGIMSILTVSSSSLYRYHYRNSQEAFRGDFKRIGGDMNSAFNRMGIDSNERR